MSKQNTSSKGFAPWRWLKRMFFGASKEYTLADERYDSPGKLAVKRFFRNPLAVIALTILVGMFLFVFIGPIFASAPTATCILGATTPTPRTPS